jgi:hypothetical protein
MIRFLPSEYFLLAVLLFFWPMTAPAQQQMQLPPLDFAVSPAPDPNSLPPPPPLEWESLDPKDSGDRTDPPRTVTIPAPQPEALIAPAPPPVPETPISDPPTLEQLELAKPDVEIWREESISPQIPPRQMAQLSQAYVTGAEPVWLRVQFDPLMVGKNVYIMPGRGITLSPSDSVRSVSSTGECVVTAQLHENVLRSHVIFYCEGVKTILPVVRATLAKVEEKEGESQP